MAGFVSFVGTAVLALTLGGATNRFLNSNRTHVFFCLRWQVLQSVKEKSRGLFFLTVSVK